MSKSRQLRVLGLYMTLGLLCAASCARESSTLEGDPSASGGKGTGKAGSPPLAGTTSSTAGTSSAFGGTASSGGKTGTSTAGANAGGEEVGGSGSGGTTTGVPPEVLARASAIVMYETHETVAATRTIQMKLYIKNQSEDPLPMSQVKIRYWLTAEAPTTLHQYYVAPQLAPPSATFVSDGDNSHVLMTFAGGSVVQGQDKALSEIQLVVENNTMDYDQSDDFSWLPTAKTETPNDKITLYLDDTLIWGCEPSGECFGDSGVGGQGVGGQGVGGQGVGGDGAGGAAQ